MKSKHFGSVATVTIASLIGFSTLKPAIAQMTVGECMQDAMRRGVSEAAAAIACSGQQGPKRPIPAVPAAIDSESFSSLIQSLHSATFDKNKISVLASTVNRIYFTSNQAAQIIRKMDFSAGQADAAVMLYPRVLDKQNWHVIYNSVDFESTKETIRQRVGS